MIKLKFVFRAPHAKNTETVDLWNELWWALGHEVGVGLEEDVGKAGSEVGTVDV